MTVYMLDHFLDAAMLFDGDNLRSFVGLHKSMLAVKLRECGIMCGGF